MNPLSFSSINTFDTCPKQFHHLYILKDVRSATTEANLWGTKCHKQLEEYIKENKEITEPAARRGVPYITAARKSLPGCAEHVEWKWGLATDWGSTKFFGDPMLRGVIDYLALSEDQTKAVVVDWKFGKKKEDLRQLSLFALSAFCHFPTVRKIRTIYAWLKTADEAPTVKDYVRADMERLKRDWLESIETVRDRLEVDSFPPKPSGLCRGWCPVESCTHYVAPKS